MYDVHIPTKSWEYQPFYNMTLNCTTRLSDSLMFTYLPLPSWEDQSSHEMNNYLYYLLKIF